MSRYAVGEQQSFQAFVIVEAALYIIYRVILWCSGKRKTHSFVSDTSHHLFKFVGMPDIVLIGDRDEITCCATECSMEISIESQVLLIDMQSDKRIAGLILLYDFCCPVCALVILNQQLVDRIGLLYNRVQLFAQKFLSVLSAHYNGYKRERGTGRRGCHVLFFLFKIRLMEYKSFPVHREKKLSSREVYNFLCKG